MIDEIELKLGLAPDALKRLQRHPLLRSLAAGRRLRTATLQSTYFDTPDRRLAKGLMALRVRSDGRRFVQTLKLGRSGGSSGLQEMTEDEVEVAGAQPEPGKVNEPTAAALLAEPGVAEALTPVFETRFERKALPIRLIDSEVEVAFDQGQILAEGRSQPLCEAEFELKSGRPERLVQLALALHEQVDFRLLSETKAARGFALAEEIEPQAREAERIDLPEQAGAGDCLTAIVRSCLGQLQANERALVAGSEDPEAVHQLRVAVRRLRAAIGCFRPIVADDTAEELAEGLDWLQSATGPARDWDVFRLETLTPLLRRLPDDTGLKALAHRVDAERERAHEAALAALADRHFTGLMLRLVLLIQDRAWRRPAEPGQLIGPAEEPGHLFARSQVARRTAAVLKRGRDRSDADEASLHELRIACKKLRYTVEFFRVFLPKAKSRDALDGLKDLQECLGSLNDAAVGRRLLEQAGEGGSKASEARALGLVQGWQASRIEHDLAHLRRAWKRARRSLAALVAD
jgi:inorganic triphosphatase YgiF